MIIQGFFRGLEIGIGIKSFDVMAQTLVPHRL